MKSIQLVAFTVFGLLTGTALAQMQGGHGGMQNDRHEGMSTQQSQQMMGSQMMSQDMMRDMSGLMQQMRDQTQRMQQLMDHRVGIDVDGQHRMARMMEEMSGTMHEMARAMQQGTMDPDSMRQLQERMQRMDRELKGFGAKEH